ncbi:MAG: chromate transporter [Oscillospiraceae bacterium]|nr:chromate transporter [Oscillospiraceae bacterium]BDE86556.1 chromate transporter [Oscillospiraceae bacterium]CUP63607.1 chromate transporter [Flavonifractor plautii]SCI70081.1 chromate transporter%2C chromate ion transporter (CHR) family [uncultured Flavonifractor sp.]
MQRANFSFWRLFLSTFQLSAFTFGGGYVIVPLMKERFVRRLGWIDEEEMLDLVSIAQSSPGAMAVNTSILVGYRMAGVPGALVSVCGTALPPLIILSVISLFYVAFRDNRVVSLVLRGMNAGVAAVICDVVLTMGRGVLRQKRALYTAVLAAAFCAAWFAEVSVVLIILCCGLIGAADTLWSRRKGAVS